MSIIRISIGLSYFYAEDIKAWSLSMEDDEVEIVVGDEDFTLLDTEVWELETGEGPRKGLWPWILKQFYGMALNNLQRQEIVDVRAYIARIQDIIKKEGIDGKIAGRPARTSG